MTKLRHATPPLCHFRFRGNDNQNHADPSARPPPPIGALGDRPRGNDRLLCAGLVGHGLFLRKQESTPRPERKSISREK